MPLLEFLFELAFCLFVFWLGYNTCQRRMRRSRTSTMTVTISATQAVQAIKDYIAEQKLPGGALHQKNSEAL